MPEHIDLLTITYLAKLGLETAIASTNPKIHSMAYDGDNLPITTEEIHKYCDRINDMVCNLHYLLGNIV